MKKFIIFLLSILWLTGCNNDSEMVIMNENENNTSLGFSENDVVKGHMRIKLKEEPIGQIAVRSVGGQVTTGIRALDGSATTLGITKMERTFPYAGKYEERIQREGMHLWYDVYFSEQVTTTRAVSEVFNLDDIEIVSPVRKISLNAPSVPSQVVLSLMENTVNGVVFPWNDPNSGKQWNLYNDGTKEWQVKGADIRLLNVWQQYNGDPNIIVAIIDEGVDLNHIDLQANLWTNPGEIAGNGLDDDENGFIDDIHGFNFAMKSPIITPYNHGTHVAGIIGATNQNGTGVCGIAGGNGSPNSGVKMMCCQILDSRTSTINSPKAIQYAADNGAIICQNSWGYTGTIDPTDKQAIDYFIKYAGCDNDGNQLPNSPMKGGIVLFATNNHNSSDLSDATPAGYEKVIGVAAIGPDFKKASYSNYGDYIDICAPGGAQTPTSAMIYSTYKNSSYDYSAGASMACPHVSAVAALIIQKHGVGKQGFTAEQLKEILLTTTYDVDSYNPKYIGQLGTGCVNASEALQAGLPDPNTPTFLLNSNPVVNGILQFKTKYELAGDAIITIYNSIGHKVLGKSLKVRQYASTSLDISKLSAGYYILLYECNGSSIKERFVKY